MVVNTCLNNQSALLTGLFNHQADRSVSSAGVMNVMDPIALNLGPVGNTSQRTFEILTTRCKSA